MLILRFVLNHGKRKRIICNMDIELLKGALDGVKFPLKPGCSPDVLLSFNNPVLVTFYEGLNTAPEHFGRVVYRRSHVQNNTVYYTFHGYAK